MNDLILTEYKDQYDFWITNYPLRDYLNSSNDEPAKIQLGWSIRWRLGGQDHRVNGPAVIRPDGGAIWRVNDIKHRTDGPAWLEADSDYSEWWVNGIETKTPKEYQELTGHSDEFMAELLMKYKFDIQP